MTRTRRVLIGLFVLSWIWLFLWSFQDFRFWVRIKVMSVVMGMTHPGIESYDAAVAVKDYQPVSGMVPVSENQLDQPSFDNIEFHGHIFRDPPPQAEFIERMDRNRTKLFVNLSGWTYTPEAYKELIEKWDSPRIMHFVGFNWEYLREQDPDWVAKMAADLEGAAKLGARGVKLWKNFGVLERLPNKAVLALDDEQLEPVWDVVAKYDMLVAIHTADPPVFYRPTNKDNERLPELAKFPQRTLFSPGVPSFDETMAQRDRLFERRRDIRFVALHLAEFAHDLKRAQEFLDRHEENVWIDIAQRHDELGRQPRATRAFIIKNRDRILYATDGMPDFKKVRIYWRFLETDDEFFDYHPPHKPKKGIWRIHGLDLPPDVLKQLYYDNAAKLLGL